MEHPVSCVLSVPTAPCVAQISNCNKALIKLNSNFCSDFSSKRLEFNSMPVHVGFALVEETWVMFFSETLGFPLPLSLDRCTTAVHSFSIDTI